MKNATYYERVDRRTVLIFRRSQLRKMFWIKTSRKIDFSGSQSLILFIYKLGYEIPVNLRMYASVL